MEQLIDVTVSVSFKNIVLALTGCAVCVCVRGSKLVLCT